MMNDMIDDIPIKDKVYNYGIKDKRVTGLSVRVHPTGRKEYIYRFYLHDKQPTMNLGDVTQNDYEQIIARLQQYNALVRQGLDPRLELHQQANPYFDYKNKRFKEISELWLGIKVNEGKLDKKTLYNYTYVCGILNQYIGEMPINQIKPITMLTTCKAIQSDHSINYGRLAKTYAGMIFRFAVTYELCENDPTTLLKGQLDTQKTRNHPALTEEESFKTLVADMYRFDDCDKIVWYALNVLPYVFVRSTDLLYWRWEDVDFGTKQWIFEPNKKGKAQMVDSLIVPLADEVIDHLKQVQAYTGLNTGLVFPSPRDNNKPLGKTTLLKNFHKMGYKGEQCVHGFRACAKTILMEKEEFRYSDMTTELQLGHLLKDSYGRAYNRVKDLTVRTKMMADWGKYIGGLQRNARDDEMG
ncbi:integrase arm-type DNA-binding domain-containing protein (plasmid) [Moraxella bovis]|uniref:Integrase arm-type DNA-binding domain-containing protein n=1 Tax=Moraxella bovis TaxID=476 RepID=A0ABY6MB60_MORBO|nr:integrase arm-type DNA-binding domain-containing protein [Moraxella bovis]UZA04760.1 integrase arm-type DNA-binding domain-containing protein [Moraxella bovis]